MSNFILSRLKEKFGEEDEEEEQQGFPDMNYIIGNSSAMDVGEFPTPLDQRIGYAAQTGGSVMELQITNPATFTIEGDEMISVIDQLGIDITLHSDMNAGYTTAYKTGQGESYGYDTVQQYFTDYIQELAYFKKRVERQGKNDEPLFEIGRINPHISTSPMPSLSERMAQDVGVDPFGFEVNDYDEDARKLRNREDKNIYKNPEFLKRLYHTLFLEVSNYPFEQYQTFAAYSKKFDEEWRKAKHLAARKLFQKEANGIEDKFGTIRTTLQRDQGVSRGWLDILDKKDIELEDSFQSYVPEISRSAGGTTLDYDGIDHEEEVTELSEALMLIAGTDSIQGVELRKLENILYQIENLKPENLSTRPLGDNEDQFRADVNPDIEAIKEILKSGIEKALDRLWYIEDADDVDGQGIPHPDEQYISQDAKWKALQSHLEIQQIRIFENSYELGKKELETSIEKLAEDVFSGDDLDLFDPSEREYIGDEEPEKMHEDMIERLITGQQFQRDMWKESVLFYNIIPAWMASSDNSTEGHKGWEAPKFIWENLIKEKWGEKEDIDLDLTDPRNGLDEGEDHFMDLLETNDEFRMDVAAASAASYAWGHFTQRRSQFDLKDRDFGLSDEEKRTVKSQGWTWIDWMNRFGIGVNLETMQGSPQQRFKIWRPKDIAMTAHAINMTARKRLDEDGELGGLERMNPEIDARPAKFTIDMEHVATMGAPPMDEMENFISQEEMLAGKVPELEIQKEKPVAKILRQMHLMDPGVEGQRGTHHGAFERGNKMLYEWLYRFVEAGFTRNEDEKGTVLFELAEHQAESTYMMRITMNMIELGIEPEEVSTDNIDLDRVENNNYRDEREALIARFFGLDSTNYSREWAKIEEHAFDPLDGLLEAEQFDYTYSSKAALENDNNPRDYSGEEYK